jgi:hypothetical protein
VKDEAAGSDGGDAMDVDSGDCVSANNSDSNNRSSSSSGDSGQQSSSNNSDGRDQSMPQPQRLTQADAQLLRSTKLSDFLYAQLELLFASMQENHDKTAGGGDNGLGFGHIAALLPSLTVRIVSSTNRKVTVNGIVREHFFDQHHNSRGCDGLPRDGNAVSVDDDGMDVDGSSSSYPERYAAESEYRSKCILLFQRIDGADVALFALYTQEYDLTSPAPNTGRVYIAYLDSVKHFQSHADRQGSVSSCPDNSKMKRVMPHGLRTAIYHEILLGYLAHASARGFENAHIWACPPQRSLSYIFWCHPPDQRTPSREHLRDWYAKLLERGKLLGITGQPEGLYETFFRFGMSDANASTVAPKTGRAKAKLVTTKKAKSGLTKGNVQGKAHGAPMELEVQSGGIDGAASGSSPSSTCPRASSIAAASTITSAFATAASGLGGKPGMEMLRRMHVQTQEKIEQEKMVEERQKQRELRAKQQAEREAKAKELKAKQQKQKHNSRNSSSRVQAPTTHHTVQTISTRGARSREWEDAISGAGDRFEWPRGLPPYFDGDFWPMEAGHLQNAEERIKQQHDRAFEHQAAVVAAGQGKPLEVSYGFNGTSFGDAVNGSEEHVVSSLARSLSKRGPELRQPSWLMKTVSASVMRQKEDHIVVALIPPPAPAGSGRGGNGRRGQSPRSRRKGSGDGGMIDGAKDTSLTMVQRAATVWSLNERDTDDVFNGRKYVDTRQAFHQLCSFSRYQFDTLRHAKHSTMMLLHRLHDTSMPLPFHACSECKLIITARRHWHCEPADFHACDSCARRHRATGKGHELVFSIPSEMDKSSS